MFPLSLFDPFQWRRSDQWLSDLLLQNPRDTEFLVLPQRARDLIPDPASFSDAGLHGYTLQLGLAS